MCRLPYITHADIPRAVLELAYLPDIHPAPIFSNLNFVARAHPDRSSTLLQYHPFSRPNNPFANPLSVI